MKPDRKNVSEKFDENEDSTNDRREALDRPTSRREGADEPSQQSQRIPFNPPESGAGKDQEIERTREDEDADFRREDKETNKSGDARIGTHGREYE